MAPTRARPGLLRHPSPVLSLLSLMFLLLPGTSTSGRNQTTRTEDPALRRLGSSPTKIACLDEAENEFGAKVTRTRNTLVTGSWANAPPGCSVERNINSPHYVRLLTYSNPKTLRTLHPPIFVYLPCVYTMLCPIRPESRMRHP